MARSMPRLPVLSVTERTTFTARGSEALRGVSVGSAGVYVARNLLGTLRGKCVDIALYTMAV
jgi:hypothetical protein